MPNTQPRKPAPHRSNDPHARFGAQLLDDLIPKTRICINPTLDAALAAVTEVQAGCRKNTLNRSHVRDAWECVCVRGEVSAVAGLQSCPRGFDYGIATTVLQVLRIDEGLIGLSASRLTVMPGGSAKEPVTTVVRLDGPSRWLREVTTAFWTHLSDETLARLRQKVVTDVMRQAAERSWLRERGYGTRYAAKRRDLHLAQLFRHGAPSFVSELAVALERIGDELARDGHAEIRWAAFKQRFASVATRYKRELLGLQRSGTLEASALRGFREETQRYTLSFDVWEGPQRLFPDAPQIVVQVCASRQYHTWRTRGGHTARLLTRLHEAATKRRHPATPTTAGWLRIHVDDLRRLVFVDEVQSDWLEDLRNVEETALAPVATAMAREIADWHVHGFASVARWARSIGYRIGTHTRESSALVPGKTQSERKWAVYYGALIQRFGLIQANVTGYGAPICVQPAEST